MATLDDPTKLVDAHWYSKDCQPAYKIKKKDGGERSTTLADARKYGFVPSVTSIFNIMAKRGLEQWKLNKAIEATKSNPHLLLVSLPLNRFTPTIFSNPFCTSFSDNT